MRPKKNLWVAVLLLACAVFAGCADKKAAGTLYIKALECYEQKDFKSADAFINQSLKLDKQNQQAKFLYAKTNFFQGRYDKAAEILLDLKKNNSDNKDIQRYLIKSLILNQQLQSADKEIQAALKSDKGDWRLYQLAAAAAAKQNDTERRLQSLNAAAKALNGSAQIYFDLALVWRSLGVDSKAGEYKEKCLALDKGYSELFDF